MFRSLTAICIGSVALCAVLPAAPGAVLPAFVPSTRSRTFSPPAFVQQSVAMSPIPWQCVHTCAFPSLPVTSLSLSDTAAAALRSARWRERSLSFLLRQFAGRELGAPMRALEAVADPSKFSGSLPPKFAGTP